ncbi:MAG TPA: class I tRNA ligase family protein, partial [Firmicutes bacterium]|nr:class I tRNA ligase family protein [Bacillota bacterium]
KSPYRKVISHGWVVDGEGKKMSKSLGNVILPEEVINSYGADILRLWVSSADFTSDIHISKDILKQLSEVYRKIRNTCRFLLGNCYDFDPARDSVEYRSLAELDRWALFRLNQLIEKITGYYEHHEYHQVFHALHNFCVTDLSNVYLDIIKDRLYCSAAGNLERRSAQTVLAIVLKNITLLMAPILTFTAEEIWQFLPKRAYPTVQIADWPEPTAQWADTELGKRWEVLLKVREEVTWVLEQYRQKKLIGGSLEASVDLWVEESFYQSLADYEDQLATIFIVSGLSLHRGFHTAPDEAITGQQCPVKIAVRKAPGHKCPRCWMFTESKQELCSRCQQVIAV